MKNYLLKIYSTLSKKQKLNSLYILILILVSLFLEMIGIGIIIPIIGLMIDYENFIQLEYTTIMYNILSQPSQLEFITYIMFFMTFIYFIKFVFFVHLTERQSEFYLDINMSMTYKLLNNYIHQPYLFFTNKHSSEIIRNVISEIDLFSLALKDIITFIIEISVIIALSLFLFFYEPITALFLFITLLLSGLIFKKFSKEKLNKFGYDRMIFDQKNIMYLQNIIGGIREIKLLNNENYFKNKFFTNNIKSLKIKKLYNIINILPRLIIEFLGIIILTVVVIYLVNTENNFEKTVTNLALFAGVALRVMPSLNRIYLNAQALSFSLSSVETLSKELKNNNIDFSNDTEELKFENFIDIRNLSFKFPNTDKNIFSNINLKINKGESIGIIGSTGCGKSTLANIISGLIIPSGGDIIIDNYKIRDVLIQWQKKIGYVSQNFFLIDDSIKNNICFGHEKINEENLKKAVKESQLDEFLNSLPKGLDTLIGEMGSRLSGGQQQRISIARALYNNPEVIIFDEATNSLDIDTESKIMDTIYNIKKDKTLILIAHRSSTLSQCDNIYELKNGSIKKVDNLFNH